MKPWPLALLAAASACTIHISDETPELPAFADVHERCTVTPDGIAQSGPFSLALTGGSYLIFGETFVGAGPELAILHNSGAVATDPCSWDYVRGADGQLATLIDLTAGEAEADVARGDGRHTALWPTAGFAAGSDGFVFYQKVLVKTYFDVVSVGTGVARLRHGEVGERLVPDAFASEPTLTWLAPQAAWGTGALVATDGLAYVYGCYQRAQFDLACRVARVALDHAADPGAYRYFTGDPSSWADRAEQAAVVLQGAGALSGVWSDHLGMYVFVYAGLLEDSVYAVTAPDPWGPFSAPRVLFTGDAPGDVNLHAGFGSADGARLLVSYRAASSVHFVDVVLP